MADKIYRPIQNDTFDAAAYRVYGDGHLCPMLMNANPEYMDVFLFEPGITLKLPDYTPKPKEADLPPWYGA